MYHTHKNTLANNYMWMSQTPELEGANPTHWDASGHTVGNAQPKLQFSVQLLDSSLVLDFSSVRLVLTSFWECQMIVQKDTGAEPKLVLSEYLCSSI